MTQDLIEKCMKDINTGMLPAKDWKDDEIVIPVQFVRATLEQYLTPHFKRIEDMWEKYEVLDNAEQVVEAGEVLIDLKTLISKD